MVHMYGYFNHPTFCGLKQTVRHLDEMTILILGYFYPKTWLSELQVKQPKFLGCFYQLQLVFTVYFLAILQRQFALPA